VGPYSEVGRTRAAAAAAIVAVPGRPAPLVALLAYLALTAVAFGLRGTRCACFGLARLASVGRAHIGVNAAAALVAAVALAAGPGSEPLVRAATGTGAAAVTLAVVVLLDRRARRAERTPAAAPCDRTISGVRMYVTDGCPSCRALKQLLETVEPARREAVVAIPVERGAKLPAPVTGMGVPCAVGVDESGEPVCSPVEGIGAVKALVDGIAVRTSPGARGREDARVR